MHALPTVEPDRTGRGKAPRRRTESTLTEELLDELPVDQASADAQASVRPDPMTFPTSPVPPLTRMILQRARLRCILPSDVIVFTAACPACGADREWTQTRDETRVISDISCDCALDLPRR